MLIRRNPNAAVESAPAVEQAAQQPAAQAVQPVVKDADPYVAAQADASAAQAAAPAAATVVAKPPAVVIPVKTPAPSTALVRASSHELSATSAALASPVLNAYKQIFEVEYDTFDRLKAGSGDIQDNDGNTLGREIEIELVSWQDAYDIGMGDNSEKAKEYVRYSDDGVTIKESNQTVNEYLEEVRPTYPNAKVSHKLVLVGRLLAAEKDSNLIGRTVQVSLSAQARKTFDRYNFDRTLDIAQGKKPADGANVLNIKAEPRKTGTNNWTLLLVTGAA